MSKAKDPKLSLKVIINKEKTKVLFAEADSDFVDVLLGFLRLPLGRIMRLLKKHYGDEAPVVGSLNTLYNSLANPKIVSFCTKDGKQKLLEDECSKMKLNVANIQHKKYDWKYDFGISEDGVFIKQVSFIICDDLRVLPNVKGSIMQTLSNIGIAITDMEGAEIRNLTFGFDEVMDLLKGSLISLDPLSYIIFGKRQLDAATTKFEPGILLHQIEKEATSNYKKMIVKLMLQKSTKKLLFAQADDDFINFLFSILTIPIGQVERLLGGNTSLKNIDNLYKSIADIDEKNFRTKDDKNWLIKPKLHSMYTSNRILPSRGEWFRPSDQSLQFSFFLPAVNFVEGPGMFMVTDDLSITPLGLTSSLSILNGLNIPLSDVEELELQIGLEEALSILKSSFTSTAALTDALPFLIDPILNKQLKQEC